MQMLNRLGIPNAELIYTYKAIIQNSNEQKCKLNTYSIVPYHSAADKLTFILDQSELLNGEETRNH